MEGWVHDDPETHDRGAKLLYFGKVCVLKCKVFL